ncbi:MAG: molecular chaperone HtpG [Ruminococcaceae bacterium]|nr:molecular chaperone HtpG [Oscillospiraceae bacterium]
MAKKAFKSESKRLLDLMINAIYTHKEIFLRELISNASDSIDKLYYIALTDENITFHKDDYYIRIEADEKNRTLTISDTGIGMSKEELEENLGTIAKSGSLEFKKELEHEEGHDIIGQFGVGFYSAFMVAEKVTVISKKHGSDEAYQWESEGADGYTVTKSAKENVGTKIILSLKPNTEDENYDEFLKEYTLRSIIKKYSDYIRYPIKMTVEKSRPKPNAEGQEGAPEYETYFEEETLNSMVPIWRKNKSELTQEDYNNFYKETFFDFEAPAAVIHTSADGITSYKALLFLPQKAPYNYYTKEFEKGLALYTNGVLIMEKCSDLLPDCFSFVRGLVDSADLSLNISREMLQHDRQLQVISKNLQKKIKSELLKLMKDQRETYEKFFSGFGRQLKFSVYNEFGREKDLVSDLILFYSVKQQKMVSLKEYIDAMAEDQKFIYYACGESNEKIARLPQTERVLDKGFDILCFTDDIDEFAIKMLGEYEKKAFKSVSSDDLGFEEENEPKEDHDDKELFLFMKEALGDKVKEVKKSMRLKSHPVCITSGGELSIEMEKVLNSMPADQKVKAERVLEINPNHPVFEKMKVLFDSDKEKLKKYAEVLYGSALLIEGLSLEDPIEFSNFICDLL